MPVSPLLLLLTGCALARLNVWPSLHVALSSSSVFMDFRTRCDSSRRLSLIDTDTNATVRTRTVSSGGLSGRVEFNCSCFLYAGTFRFLLQQTCPGPSDNTTLAHSTDRWWSSELRVQWPTFHISVERAADRAWAFQVRLSSSRHFQACSSAPGSALYLEVSHLDHSSDQVQVHTRRPVRLVSSQVIGLSCAFAFTDLDFIRVSLRSPHSAQEVTGAGPLHLTRLFSYELQVEDPQRFRSGCEGLLPVRLLAPPCARVQGKLLLYEDGAAQGRPPLTSSPLTPGRDLTLFNCSVFSAGRSKYCVRAVLDSGGWSGPHTCLVVQRSSGEDSWGPWQQWSVCSATCGEGVRERARDCLLPSSVGGMKCTGMVKEQSRCSLENCAVLAAPSPSSPSSPASVLGGSVVAVTGISLCLCVVLATVVVTLWRKLCSAPSCSSVRRGSAQPPGGRKLSDQTSICRSLPPPSLSEPLPQDPERLSPSGQKMLPSVFGYRLAQQQLKHMKEIGLKEATQMYHVSSSPVQDTFVATPTTSPVPSPTAFVLPAPPPQIHPSVVHGEAGSEAPRTSGRSRARTAEWVEMVARSGLGRDPGPSRNPSFRRTSSFNDPKPQLGPSPGFRERSLTQVGCRTLPEGSSWAGRARAWQPYLTIPEHQTQAGLQRNILDESSCGHAGTSTSICSPAGPARVEEGVSGIGGPVDRAEQNWNRRGPSPIQRNILARKLKEAHSSRGGRQRSSTFSASPSVQKKSGPQRASHIFCTVDRSSYRLSEAEQRALDLDLTST